MTRQQLAIIALALAIQETVKEAGENGAPEGPLYAAFMARGMSLEFFQGLVNGLIDAKRIVRRNHCLFAV